MSMLSTGNLSRVILMLLVKYVLAFYGVGKSTEAERTLWEKALRQSVGKSAEAERRVWEKALGQSAHCGKKSRQCAPRGKKR